MKNNVNRAIIAAVAGLLVVAISDFAAAFPSRGGSCTECHVSPGGSLTATPNPLNVTLSSSGLMTFSVTSLGSSSNTAISVQGLSNPALNATLPPGGNTTWTYRSNATYGNSYVSSIITSPGSYTLNLAIGALATPGTYPIVVMYAGDGEACTVTGFNLNAILPPVDDADFDNDGDVDGRDFLTWQRGYGTGTNNSTGDANGSGTVNGADLTIWQGQYNGGALSAVTVPEPATALLLVLGFLGTCRLGRVH
jgi:hypothetical protein